MNAYESPPCAVVMDVERACQSCFTGDSQLYGDTVNFATPDAMARAHRENSVAVRRDFFEQALDAEQVSPLKGPVDHFLDELYELNSTNDTDRAVDFTFATMHWWLAQGGTKVCDAILDKVDVSRLGTDSILAFLAITFSARNQLRRRKAYYERAKRAVRKNCGWVLAHRLLSPLK